MHFVSMSTNLIRDEYIGSQHWMGMQINNVEINHATR